VTPNQEAGSVDARIESLEEQLSKLADELIHEREERARTRRQLHESKDEVAELEEHVGHLEDEVAALRSQVQVDPTTMAYEAMDRKQRVKKLRIALARRARQNGGRAYYRYRDVLSLFDEKPSDGYAFKLMRIAAGYDDETRVSSVDGFEFGDHNGSKALRAVWDDVSDDAVIHAVKNGRRETE
jgi:chromosome segregation ATPase